MKRKLLMAGGVLTAIAVGCLMCRLFPTRKTNWQTAEPGTILVNYYEATRATIGGNHHLEYVLRKTEETDSVKLEVYRGREGEEETCVEYTAAVEVVDRCFEIIDGKRLSDWNETYDGGLGGGIVVCRFYDGEKQIRVSTDCMPEGGEWILREIGSVIAEYAKKDHGVGSCKGKQVEF